MNLIHGISNALKGVIFLGGLCLCGVAFYLLCDIPWGHSFVFWVIMAPGIALTIILLWSNFFARVRQWLKPFWLTAVLVWLIPYVGVMEASSIRGMQWNGIPLPIGKVGGINDPWDVAFRDAYLIAIMLCVLAAACIFARVAKRLPIKALRLAVLIPFCVFCILTAYDALPTHLQRWNGDDAKSLSWMYSHWPALALWIVPACIAAWRIIGELLPPNSREEPPAVHGRTPEKV